MGRVNATDKMPVGDDWSGGHEVNRCRLPLLPVVAFVVALWCGLTPYGGSKQTARAADAGQPEASSPAPSAETIREVVAGLSNEQVRELLIRQLTPLAPTAPASGTIPALEIQQRDGTTRLIEAVQERGHLLRDRLAAMFGSADRLLTLPGVLVRWLSGEQGSATLLKVVLGFAAVLGVAFAAERLFRRSLPDLSPQTTGPSENSIGMRLRVQLAGLAMDLLALIVFLAAAFAMFFIFWHGHLPSRQTILGYVMALTMVRLTGILADFFLAPGTRALRLVRVSDRYAGVLRASFLRLATLMAFGYVTAALFQLAGLDEHLRSLIVFGIWTLFVGLTVAMVWPTRRELAACLRTGRDAEAIPGRLHSIAAGFWHVPASAYILFIFVLAESAALSGVSGAILRGTASLVIPMVFPLVGLTGAALLAERGGAKAETAADGKAPAQPAIPALILPRAWWILLTVAGILLLAAVWDIDVFSAAQRNLGGAITRAVFNNAIALLLGYLLWESVKVAIDRRLARERANTGPSESGEGGGAGTSRLGTLLPLFRGVVLVTILVIVTLVVLTEIGVDIGPLLAGAGVIGLAIGFGSQTLVRDVISGAFFLLDDAFRLGEYVEIGNIRGTVERISVRSLRLRHHRGAVHTVPFGEIKHLTNYSRDWVIEKLEIRLPFDTDLRVVRRLVKRIGQELQADPDLGPHLLEPLKSQGVRRMEENAMIVALKFMAKPGEQFVLRREVYQRIRDEFEKNGIHFARPQVLVHVPDTKPGGEPAPEALAAAAADALAASGAGGQRNAPV